MKGPRDIKDSRDYKDITSCMFFMSFRSRGPSSCPVSPTALARPQLFLDLSLIANSQAALAAYTRSPGKSFRSRQGGRFQQDCSKRVDAAENGHVASAGFTQKFNFIRNRSFRMSRSVRFLSLMTALALLTGAGTGRAAATDLGAAQLLIAGTRLTVDPAQQTVPFDTGTLVNTHLQGYDATRGTLPPSFKVVGDLTGPEIDGVLTLETVPNQPFRIPRLTLKGDVPAGQHPAGGRRRPAGLRRAPVGGHPGDPDPGHPRRVAAADGRRDPRQGHRHRRGQFPRRQFHLRLRRRPGQGRRAERGLFSHNDNGDGGLLGGIRATTIRFRSRASSRSSRPRSLSPTWSRRDARRTAAASACRRSRRPSCCRSTTSSSTSSSPSCCWRRTARRPATGWCCAT